MEERSRRTSHARISTLAAMKAAGLPIASPAAWASRRKCSRTFSGGAIHRPLAKMPESSEIRTARHLLHGKLCADGSRLAKRLPAITNRSGHSAQCVIPIRGVTRISKRDFIALASNLQCPARQVGAVLPARDSHRQREFAGSRSQVFDALGRRTTPPHGRDSGQRFERADQNAPRLAFFFGHKVQALVHAVDEVHVSVAGRSEHARAFDR